MGKVLLFNISDEKKLTAVRLTGLRFGFEVQTVLPERQSCTVEQLLRGEDGENGTPVFGDEMMLMAGLASQAFHALLDTLRENGMPVRLKAVVTEHNRGWTAERLHRELLAEAQAMEKQKKSIHGRK
ncbi:MAG: DUF3783 domain-containing protein [Oscillospiraceae bacterium]|nr:DUF3783 domain-containing protein [Oscillospiraceae bacterium]